MEDETNPAHYCFICDKYLGHRGFCSQECHDSFYDNYVGRPDTSKNEWTASNGDAK